MRITRDRKSRKFLLSQERDIKKVLKRFNMKKSKPVSSSFIGHFKLSSKQYLISEKDKEYMKKISYAYAVGSLMYAIIYTKSDITYAVGVISQFLSNPDRKY